jgi:hypothetical protein
MAEVHEIADGIFRIATFIPEANITFNQFLVADEKPLLERQALHAHRLAFTNPTTGERMQFEAPLPPDMEATLKALHNWREK